MFLQRFRIVHVHAKASWIPAGGEYHRMGEVGWDFWMEVVLSNPSAQAESATAGCPICYLFRVFSFFIFIVSFTVLEFSSSIS